MLYVEHIRTFLNLKNLTTTVWHVLFTSPQEGRKKGHLPGFISATEKSIANAGSNNHNHKDLHQRRQRLKKTEDKNHTSGTDETSPCTKIAMKLNPLYKNALDKGKAIILEELAPKPWQEVARPQVGEEKLVGGLGGAAERAWMRQHTFIYFAFEDPRKDNKT